MRRRKRQFKRTNPMSAMSEINITSLLDLSFCLLIIFMIATPLIEANNPTQTVPLNLPTESTKPQQPNEDIKYITISVDLSSQIYYNGQSVTLEKLNELLRGAARQPKDRQPVIAVQADKSAPYQDVIKILDAVRTNGLEKISLDTEGQ